MDLEKESSYQQIKKEQVFLASQPEDFLEYAEVKLSAGIESSTMLVLDVMYRGKRHGLIINENASPLICQKTTKQLISEMESHRFLLPKEVLKNLLHTIEEKNPYHCPYINSEYILQPVDALDAPTNVWYNLHYLDALDKYELNNQPLGTVLCFTDQLRLMLNRQPAAVRQTLKKAMHYVDIYYQVLDQLLEGEGVGLNPGVTKRWLALSERFYQLTDRQPVYLEENQWIERWSELQFYLNKANTLQNISVKEVTDYYEQTSLPLFI